MRETYHGRECISCGNTEKYSKSSSCVNCAVGRNSRARIPGSIEHKKKLLSDAKYRAKQKNIPFNITVDDIIVPEKCPVFGTRLEINSSGMSSPNSPSIDRIISEWGYIKGNIIVISHRANTIKQNASPSELGIIYRFFREKHHELVEKKEMSSL